jgi:hypothetical protein
MGSGDRPQPIFSERVDDPAWSDAIDSFVLGLAERIDELQDVESRGAFGDVARLAGELAGRAGEVGYGGLAAAARAAEAAARDEKAEGTHARLVEVTELAHRIRLGHRGAL